MFCTLKLAGSLAGCSALAAVVGLHHSALLGDHPVPAVIGALDADGDGVLSAAEIDGAPAALRGLDRDHDGRVDRSELWGSTAIALHGAASLHAASLHTALLHEDFTDEQILTAIHHLLLADTNEDGVLDDDEMWAAARKAKDHPEIPGSDLPPEQIVALIRSHDTDGDGQVEREELLAQAHEHMGAAHGAKPAATGHHGITGSAAALVEHFLSFDQNGDGVLDKSEVPEAGKQLFVEGDLDGNGKLDAAEIHGLAERLAKSHEESAKPTRRSF